MYHFVRANDRQSNETNACKVAPRKLIPVDVLHIASVSFLLYSARSAMRKRSGGNKRFHFIARRKVLRRSSLLIYKATALVLNVNLIHWTQLPFMLRELSGIAL